MGPFLTLSVFLLKYWVLYFSLSFNELGRTLIELVSSTFEPESSIWNNELFSAPEPKVQVHYRDHALSVVNFSHFDFSSETTKRNSTKLDSKQDLNVLCLWLSETYLASLKLLNGIQQKLDGKQDLNVLYQVCIFGSIGKPRWSPQLLIAWDIFDFSSETAERNSTKLYRKQYLNFLYHVCVFGPIWKPSCPPKPLNGSTIFDVSSETAEQNSTKLTTKQDLNVLYHGLIGKPRWLPLPLIGLDVFNFSEKAEQNSMKLDRKQDLDVLYHVCVFRADRKTRIAVLPWPLIGLYIIDWNHWTELNATWQGARSQCPVPIEVHQKPRWPPWPLIGWDIFEFLCETAERNSTKRDRKQDFNVLYQVCVFWADRKTKIGTPNSDWLWNFWLLFYATAEWNSTKLDYNISKLQGHIFTMIIIKSLFNCRQNNNVW